MKRGTKVVCIDGKFPQWVFELYQQLPVEGDIYTVRENNVGKVGLGPKEMELELVTDAILLNEIRNPADPTCKGGLELSFKSERFREVNEADNVVAVSRELQAV